MNDDVEYLLVLVLAALALAALVLGYMGLVYRRLKGQEERVARAMALLAGLTVVVALGAGLVMHRRRWSEVFEIKFRMLAVVVVAQTVLTAVAPQLRSEAGLLIWVVLASVALGFGVPSLFGLTCDLVPTRHRGTVAAVQLRPRRGSNGTSGANAR